MSSLPKRDWSLSCKIPERTIALMKERAAEEGVSFAALVRRALGEWLTLTHGQPKMRTRPEKPLEPIVKMPTVAVSRRMVLALEERGHRKVVIARALNEWLLL